MMRFESWLFVLILLYMYRSSKNNRLEQAKQENRVTESGAFAGRGPVSESKARRIASGSTAATAYSTKYRSVACGVTGLDDLQAAASTSLSFFRFFFLFFFGVIHSRYEMDGELMVATVM
jgi:cbb3-type cytochrome oxidase subunit 3